VAPQWRELAVPPVVSWMEDEAMPERFDYQATNDYVAWLAAPASLAVLAELDWPRRRIELAEMLDGGAALVAKAIGTSVAEPAHPAPLMRLVEVPLDGEDALEPFKARAAAEIAAELTVTAYGDRSFLRLSAHAYNSPADYELLADRLPSLLAATI
jgi:isopenicillin-N epimerase